jgi:hypothetical protein
MADGPRRIEQGEVTFGDAERLAAFQKAHRL